jgi:dihydrolipoamide dehydrogenase
MEFAYVLTNYGVKVTIIEFLDRALPNEDADVSKEIAKQYKNLGVDILVSTKVESVVDSGDKVTVTYTDNKSGEKGRSKPTRCSCRSASRPRRGLRPGEHRREAHRARRDRDRRLHAHERRGHLRDRRRHRQAAARHVAEAQGVVAAETIGGAETMALGDYRMMPRATFCSPQVASFGYTEAQYKETGREYKVATFPFMANGKAHGLGEPVGFVKLIADAEHLELVGGHLIGPDVSELLPELTLAQKWDLTALELARNVHTHPTLSEALQEAFHGLAGHMINL